jgi:iron-sulfur cluster protein
VGKVDRARKERHEQLLQSIQQSLHDIERRKALYVGTESMRELSELCYGEMADAEALLGRAREIKRTAIDDWNGNLERFMKTARENGAKVHYAGDAEEAVGYVVRIARDRNARVIIKTKSMTGEEIRLTHRLSDEGFEVVETDLGERVVQIAHERPSHLVAPAIHMTVDQIAKILSEFYGKETPRDPEALTSLVRESLHEDFFRGQIGIIGANFAVADSGAVGIVTNEGNARLVTSLPSTLIAIAGREKIVPSLEDAFVLLQALVQSAGARKITSYVTFLAGKSPLGFGDPSVGEFHLIVLDNGRSKMREDLAFREALSCIRCGACMDACPTFRLVGGHVFGHIYVGPIGIPWTYFVHDARKAGEIAPLCISCGLCREACPEDIDLPFLIGKVKESDVAERGQLWVNRVMLSYESFVNLASATSPISNFLMRRGVFRVLLEKAIGLDRRRPLPAFTRHTLQNWNRSRPRKRGPKKVAYFVDTFADRNETSIGKAVVEILEANDCTVEVPRQRGTGMPAFLYGNAKKTSKAAEYNVRSLRGLVEEGFEVVTSEPTANYCLRELYPRLLGTSDAALVAAHSTDVFAYLLQSKPYSLRASGREDDRAIAYYNPCHTRSVYSSSPALEALRRTGVRVEQVRYNTCCGMAGTFGFKKGVEGYDVSMEIGKTLFERIRAMQARVIATESSVCKMHIEHGCKLPVEHPIMLLRTHD